MSQTPPLPPDPDAEPSAVAAADAVESVDPTVDLPGPPDPAADAAVRDLLAGLDVPTMPAGVWDRLEAALADEQVARPAAATVPPAGGEPGAAGEPDPGADSVPAGRDSVVPLGGRVARRTQARARRTRLLGGLVAASAAVLAAGIGLSALRDAGGPPVPASADAAVPEVAGAAAAVPALRIMQTGTEYTQNRFRGQVQDLLARDDVDDAVPMGMEALSRGRPVTGLAGPPTPVGESGFTATWSGLSECVAGLVTATQVGQAIVIDRARYEGRDVGVVVLAADDSPAKVDVWVVRPDCGRADPGVIFFYRTAVDG